MKFWIIRKETGNKYGDAIFLSNLVDYTMYCEECSEQIHDNLFIANFGASSGEVIDLKNEDSFDEFYELEPFHVKCFIKKSTPYFKKKINRIIKENNTELMARLI